MTFRSLILIADRTYPPTIYVHSRPVLAMTGTTKRRVFRNERVEQQIVEDR